MSSRDCFTFSVMVGAGETFFPAFVLALGFSQTSSGMLATLPFLAAAVLQLWAPKIIARLGSFRTWLTALALLQAFCFLPLILSALFGPLLGASLGASREAVSLPWVFLILAVYWLCNLGSGPAWNSWMSHLVPLSVRPGFFAIRGRLEQAGLLIGLLVAAVSLESAKSFGHELWAFAGLFCLASTARLYSAWCLAHQTETPHAVLQQTPLSWREMWNRVRTGRDGQLISLLALYQIAIHISSPFFNPFMLKQLNLSYGEYIGLIAVSFVAKIAVYPWLGGLGRRWGALNLMQFGALITSILPILWVISDSLMWLTLAQVISGVAWAIFTLGATLSLFTVVRDSERTAFLSMFNLMHAVCVVLGSLLGAKVLALSGESYGGYVAIFVISTLARFLFAVAFVRLQHRQKLPVFSWLRPTRKVNNVNTQEQNELQAG